MVQNDGTKPVCIQSKESVPKMLIVMRRSSGCGWPSQDDGHQTRVMQLSRKLRLIVSLEILILVRRVTTNNIGFSIRRDGTGAEDPGTSSHAQ